MHRWRLLVSLENILEQTRALVFSPWCLLSLKAYLCLQWVMSEPATSAANSLRAADRLYIYLCISGMMEFFAEPGKSRHASM